MMNCQACGSEILTSDRFCKNCGAPMAASVEDLTDTHRFDNSAAAADPRSAANYTVSTTYPLAPASGSLKKPWWSIPNLRNRNLVWIFAFLMLFVFIGGGITIGRDMRRARRAEGFERVQRAGKAAQAKQQKQAEAARKVLEEAVQNALGFIPANLSDQEYPNTAGVFVTNLTSDDSPAAVARLEAGDVLTDLGDQKIRNGSELLKVLSSIKPGSDVGIKGLRDDQPFASTIRVASQTAAPFQPSVAPKDQGFFGFGDVARRCCMPGTTKWGLEIHRIVDNSPADLAGMQLGDIITEFDKHIVRTPSELARRIHAAKPRSKVKVRFYRAGVEQTIEFVMGHGWGTVADLHANR